MSILVGICLRLKLQVRWWFLNPPIPRTSSLSLNPFFYYSTCSVYSILVGWLRVQKALPPFLNDSMWEIPPNQEPSVVTVHFHLLFNLFNLFWWMTQRTREHAWLSVCCSSNAKWSTLTEGRMWLDRTSPHLILCLREQKALPPQESYCHHAWLSVCCNSHALAKHITLNESWRW